MTAVTKWLFTRDLPRGPGLMAAVRIGLGLMWISNLSWKVPPEFGRGSAGGLYSYLADAVAHPVFPPYSWIVEHAVMPQFLLFAWVTVAVETMLAVMLLTGTLTRLAALLGMAQSVAIGLSVAATPNEWPWSYVLMVLGHLAVLTFVPVTVPGLDRVRYTVADRPALAARQLTGWGAAAVVAGVWSAAASLGDPLASGGTSVGLSVLQLQVGQFNLLGGLLLILLGVAMIIAARRRAATYALVAGAVALVAALSVVARWGFGSVPLGGNGSSTALFLSLAVVALILGKVLGQDPPAPGRHPVPTAAESADPREAEPRPA